MPWTFSHPSVVFPLKHLKIGKFLNLPALVIGSVSPDLFYSVGLFKLATKAHHLIGWFYTAFPLCIVLFIILSMLSKPLEQILPIPIKLCTEWKLSNCVNCFFFVYWGSHTYFMGWLYS